MRKKKVLWDMALNIISTSIPTIVLQLLILPLIATYVDKEKYGLMVTVLAVLNVIPSTMGNILNNIRLLYEENYKKINQKGDFQLLLIISEIINISIVLGLSIYYMGASDFVGIVLIILVGIIWLSREYHIVAFRIKLDYIAILLNNICMVIGYAGGYLLFRILGYWQLIYITGILASYAYIFLKSDICTEPLKKTKLWERVSKDTFFLVVASILAKTINYADKMLLYPFLGGSAVSIYYVATIFGKVVSMAITPINSVALSYLSKMEKKPDALFRQSYFLGIVVCGIGYIMAITLSKPILGIIYPMYVTDALKYIYITSATIAVNVQTSIITPFVLKFFDIKWQMCINGLTTVSYVTISLFLLKHNGLYGFCVGALIVNILKLLITTAIYIFGRGVQNAN